MWCQLQQEIARQQARYRCDLLKQLYLCGVNYNINELNHNQNRVVICLKSCIFVVSITTLEKYGVSAYCCDLLKKLYLCGAKLRKECNLLELSVG